MRRRGVNSSSSFCNCKILDGKLMDEPIEEALEEYAFQPSSDIDHRFNDEQKEQPTEEPVKESERVNSNEKKRMLDPNSGELNLVEHRLPKKLKPEQCLKLKLDIEPLVTHPSNECRTPSSSCCDGKTSEKQENTGSSGKRRRSRWDSQCEGDGGNEGAQEGNDDDRASKKRKTKWSNDDAQLKMLGPIKLPDFMKELVAATIADPEIQELNRRLSTINSKLRGGELNDDRSEEVRSPSPSPVYDNLGFRMNSRDVRLREKLIQERQDIISRLIQKNPTFKTPPKPNPPKFSKKLYIPFREYPGYNFVGLIIGPRGNTQKRMEKETGAKIVLRGKGSVKDKSAQKKVDPSDNEDLHILVEADNQESLDAAVGMVEKLLIPVDEGLNDHKRAQLQELAKLNGSLRDENLCRICREEGHKSYACPNQNSTFNSSCNRCSRSHISFTCPFMTPTPCSTAGKNGLGTSPSYGSYSFPGVGSTPTVDSNMHKEADDANVFVGHLPQTVDENRFVELFSPFGRLVEAKMIKDRNTGFHKGYGFVRYDTPVNAAAAVATMNGYPVDGKTLSVKVAGNPPVSGSSPSISLLRKYPTIALKESPNQTTFPGRPGSSPSISFLKKYPTAVLKDSPSQTNWPGPPGSMLYEPRTPSYKCDGLGLPPLSIFPGHTDSSSGKKLPSSHGSSSHLSPSSLAWFPGNLDYQSSSSYQSYFLNTPTSSQSPQLYLTQPLGSRLTPFSYSPSLNRYEFVDLEKVRR